MRAIDDLHINSIVKSLIYNVEECVAASHLSICQIRYFRFNFPQKKLFKFIEWNWWIFGETNLWEFFTAHQKIREKNRWELLYNFIRRECHKIYGNLTHRINMKSTNRVLGGGGGWDYNGLTLLVAQFYGLTLQAVQLPHREASILGHLRVVLKRLFHHRTLLHIKCN